MCLNSLSNLAVKELIFLEAQLLVVAVAVRPILIVLAILFLETGGRDPHILIRS